MRSERAPLRLALAGFGTVGMGLADILEQNREELTARAGREIRIHSVLVRDPAKVRVRPLPSGARLCADISELVQDARVDVVVELMGGLETPRRLIRAALEAGKPVLGICRDLQFMDAALGGALWSGPVIAPARSITPRPGPGSRPPIW